MAVNCGPAGLAASKSEAKISAIVASVYLAK